MTLPFCNPPLNEKLKTIPEAIPAAAPAATRAIRLSRLFSIISEHALAHDLPISTLGPSGPNEQPVPKVTAAWIAFTVGKMAPRKLIPCLCPCFTSFSCSNISSNPCIIPTTTPPVTGISSILCQVSANLCRRSHAAPSLGVPAHAHSWMT